MSCNDKMVAISSFIILPTGMPVQPEMTSPTICASTQTRIRPSSPCSAESSLSSAESCDAQLCGIKLGVRGDGRRCGCSCRRLRSAFRRGNGSTCGRRRSRRDLIAATVHRRATLQLDPDVTNSSSQGHVLCPTAPAGLRAEPQPPTSSWISRQVFLRGQRRPQLRAAKSAAALPGRQSVEWRLQ